MNDKYLKQKGINAEQLKDEHLGDSAGRFNIYMDRQGWLFAVKITDPSVVVPLYWQIG